MTSPDPDPAVVQPGDTPPGSDSMSGANSGENSSTGPVSGNRTPMIIALSVLGLIVVMVAVMVVAILIPSG